ncbi:MAG: DUF1156 domain-containing protein, partial [Ectothiorhodospiraceae bacterium AqS1]|nr:DUF1156 domain-containing protein [Ectothiorhodospiraceae bacterium AqS1]
MNTAAQREKSIRHGHPSTLHIWWARRPLAVARAVLFAQLINDPGYQRELGFGVNKKDAERKREYLFQIIQDMVKWENTNNEKVLNRAREAIRESWRETCHLNRHHPQSAELFDPDKLPAFHDPFAGGGSIPLEAQRLGLEAYASDLNPVAVMINKAMIEIPPKFRGQKPVGPLPKEEKEQKVVEDWAGAKGLAEDVRRYGYWMQAEAYKRIGHLYPKVKITSEMTTDRPDLKAYEGQELTVIAWLWARTVKSPNPAYSHVDVPLVRSFVLAKREGKQSWIEPIISDSEYRFKVRIGKQPADAMAGTVERTGATCIMSQSVIPLKYIRSEAKSGRMRYKLMAVVAKGLKDRVYLSPSREIEKISLNAIPQNVPESYMPEKALGFRVQGYGMIKHRDLFTSRQLVALTTFSDLIHDVREYVLSDAKAAGMEDGELDLNQGGSGARAYADAISVYLSFAVDKGANYWSSLCSWDLGRGTVTNTFGRQALPMVWDFAEANAFSKSTGSFLIGIAQIAKVLNRFPTNSDAYSFQGDAQTQDITHNKVVSTDPPYYDNIGYADLSDFFYIWMRRSLRPIFSDLFATMAVPKSEELIATPFRHSSKKKAEEFFMDGMTQAIQNISMKSHPLFPITVYYAFRQSDITEQGTGNTGWETFLEAVVRSGFAIIGTWPMRTEDTGKLKKTVNALASSIVLVCRKRIIKNDTISRRDFQRQLRDKMPEALETMIGKANIAPVDLAQSAIGPGMAIFSEYEAVINQDGSRMSVHDALILINRSITDYLSPESGNFDSDTQFCSSWFEQHGWSKGPFGEADTLSRAKGTSVDGIKESGVLESGGGKVRLLKWLEYEFVCDTMKSILPP